METFQKLFDEHAMHLVIKCHPYIDLCVNSILTRRITILEACAKSTMRFRTLQSTWSTITCMQFYLRVRSYRANDGVVEATCVQVGNVRQ